MLKAYDIAAGWPKAVDPGGPGIPPVISGILPETGALPALIPATSGFPLAVARQFPGSYPLGSRPQGPESGPVRPGQTFEILKIAYHGSDHSGAVFSFFIFHFPFKPVAVRKDPEKRAKSARGFTVKFRSINRPSGPVRPGQTFEILKKSPAMAATAPVRFFHFSFFIFHLTRWPSARTRSQPRSDLVRPLKFLNVLVNPERRGKQSPPSWPRISEFGFLSDFGLRPSDFPRRQAQSDPVRPLKFLKNAPNRKKYPAAPAAQIDRQAPNSCAFKLHAHSTLVFWGFKVIQGCSRLNFFSGRRGPKWGPPQEEMRARSRAFMSQFCVLELLAGIGYTFPVATNDLRPAAGACFRRPAWELPLN